MHQRYPQRAIRFKRLTSREQRPRMAGANLGKHKRRDRRRHEPELHFAERAQDGLAGHTDISGRDTAAAATESNSLRSSDQNRVTVGHGVEQTREVESVTVILLFRVSRRFSHPLKIASRAERFAL